MNYVHLFFAFSSNYFLSFSHDIIITKAAKAKLSGCFNII